MEDGSRRRLKENTQSFFFFKHAYWLTQLTNTIASEGKTLSHVSFHVPPTTSTIWLQSLESKARFIIHMSITKQQQIKGTAWMSLAASSKTQEETEELKKESLSRKAEPEDLGSSQVVNLAKSEKACSRGKHQGCGWIFTAWERSSLISSIRNKYRWARHQHRTRPAWTMTRKKAELKTGCHMAGILQMGQQNHLAVNKIWEEWAWRWFRDGQGCPPTLGPTSVSSLVSGDHVAAPGALEGKATTLMAWMSQADVS